MNPIRLCLLLIGLVLPANSADAGTYKCDAVDNLARLGYDGSDKIAIVGKDKECKFSIGGASADGASSTSFEFSQMAIDQELLQHAPERFISERLVPIIREAAAAFEETKDFFSDNSVNSDLQNLSCSDGQSAVVGDLKIRCVAFSDFQEDGRSSFENGMVTAVLFRPTYVFEIRDSQPIETILTIFIPYR